MHPKAIATFDELMSKPLFTSVGSCKSERVEAVDSWRKAIEESSTDLWVELRHEAKNNLSETLNLVARKAYNDSWNPCVDEIKAHIVDFLEQQIDCLYLDDEMNKLLNTKVSYDFVGIGLEAHFSDYVPPSFYIGLSYWYAQGHFPCGWRGKYPKGKIVIY
jgi:hypothetical protein